MTRGIQFILTNNQIDSRLNGEIININKLLEKCKFCGTKLRHSFVDLGLSPPCNSFVDDKNVAEEYYPLNAYVCDICFLVQLGTCIAPEKIFDEYIYFSSYSETWVKHAKKYVDMAVDKFDLNESSFVVEVASNDGYLLQHFTDKAIPTLGVEPAKNVAKIAVNKGIPTLTKYFNQTTAEAIVSDYGLADLIVGNNVMAQALNINDFVAGLKILLKPGGTITIEFPHLLNIIGNKQFDTIYHEHYFYYSLFTVEKIFSAHSLKLYDVEQLKSHGGSLRIYACHDHDDRKSIAHRVTELLSIEVDKGLLNLEVYACFNEKVKSIKKDIINFLTDNKANGKTFVCYGAPGKGNTLLNYCGIANDIIDYAVDKSNEKQGKHTPGSKIPIFSPDKIRETKPDYLIIMPWNLKHEVMKQTDFIRGWGGKHVTFIPNVQIQD